MRLAAAALCLAPSIPMLFMGEEFAARTPFLFFCDFEGELARAVREGRRKEFAHFERFSDPGAREQIPDPLAEHTFLQSKLDWSQPPRGEHARWLAHYRGLLATRARHIVPRLGDKPAHGRFRIEGASGLECTWTLADGARLHLRANFGGEPVSLAQGPGELLHLEGDPPAARSLAPWSGAWTLEAA
jgi:1,4-alpha-glucan branching enzyme